MNPSRVGHQILMGVYDSPWLQESVYIVQRQLYPHHVSVWDQGQGGQWFRAEMICVPSPDAWSPFQTLLAATLGTVIMNELLDLVFDWVFLLTDLQKVLVSESIPWSHKKIKSPLCHL